MCWRNCAVPSKRIWRSSALTEGDTPAGMHRLRSRVLAHLEVIYGDRARELADSIIGAMRYLDTVTEPVPYQNYWDESDCWMITYATSIREESQPGLKTLLAFCDEHLADTVSGLHILPFYPYSSDDGFAVMDYCVRSTTQTASWEDVQSIARSLSPDG